MCYKHKLPKFKVIDCQPTVTKSQKKEDAMCYSMKTHPKLRSSHPKETFNRLP